jgi:hypothetical protein
MSFAINPSLTYIDIPETHILMLYRSKGQVQLTDARFRNHPCEAFICVCKIEKTVSARVALFETGMNSIFVYTSDLSADQSPDYPKVLAEAQEFTASFGFTMEKVNLDFSPAMREVIIRGISVMRPPRKKVRLRSLSSLDHLEPAAPKAAGSSAPTLPDTADKRPADLAAAEPQADLAAARVLIEKLTREKKALEQHAAREMAALKAAAENAAKSGKSTESMLRQDIAAIKAEKLASASVQHNERIRQLESSLAQAEASVKALTEDVARLAGKTELLEKEKLQLEELFATEKSLAADKIATLALFETSWRESQQREESLCRNIDLMQQEIDRLAADLEKQGLRENREEMLLQKIAALEQEAETSQREFALLADNTPDVTALEAEINNLTAAKNEVEAEYIRMANEAMEKEAEALDNLYTADAEILRLSRELELQQQAAKKEVDALRKELKLRLMPSAPEPARAEPARQTEAAPAAPSAASAEKPGRPASMPLEPEPAPAPVPPPPPTQTPAPTPAPSPAPAPAPAPEPPSPASPEPGSGQAFAEDDNPDETIAGEPGITNGLLNEFGSFCGNSGHAPAEFKIDPDIHKIDYSDPAEVLAILYSSNAVQAVPDGSSMQRCKGYVIAIKRAGAYRAYLVWYLTESSKVVICTPDRQPADAAECTLVLQDAIAYFEIVGFMMELEDLGSTVRSYNKAIRKVPALVRT